MNQRIDRYELQGELGRGGAGVVYRAWDTEARRPVALKVLLGLDDQQQARLRREARALASLRHPGVVAVHSLGSCQGHPYLVLELVEGRSLAERIRAHGPLEPEDVVRMGIALADALAAVHAHGLVHRDVKPDNVLVDADGRPQLTDFGLVKHLDPGAASQHLTRSGTMQGTPGYWSPEQASGALGEVGPATDVYGLGATLYGALTGSPPVDADTFQELLAATLRRPPTPPSKLREGVPPDLEDVVLTCLRKDPGERYPSAAALRDALKTARLEAPRRRLSAGVLLASAGVLLLAGVAGALLPGEPAPSPPQAAPPPDPTASPLQRARVIEEAEGPLAALPGLREAAAAGDVECMVRLGQLLSQEEVVPRDDVEAATWFEQAARAGDPQGMSEWGFMLAKGRGVEEDGVRAREWFRKAAEAGNPEGMSNYGWAHQKGIGGPRDPAAALHWLQRASDVGHPAALLLLGIAYVEGDGVPRDAPKGLSMLQEAAEEKPEALTWLARYLRAGVVTPRDAPRAFEYYLEAGERGVPRGFTSAGRMLVDGAEGVPSDPIGGERLLRRAADQGDLSASTILGQYLELGRLGPQDFGQALELYERAARGGDHGGMFFFAQALLRRARPGDPEAAYRWIRRSAEAGFPLAMFEQGRACQSGAAPGGLTEALRWYRAAADAGNAQAASALERLEAR